MDNAAIDRLLYLLADHHYLGFQVWRSIVQNWLKLFRYIEETMLIVSYAKSWAFTCFATYGRGFVNFATYSDDRFRTMPIKMES